MINNIYFYNHRFDFVFSLIESYAIFSFYSANVGMDFQLEYSTEIRKIPRF